MSRPQPRLTPVEAIAWTVLGVIAIAIAISPIGPVIAAHVAETVRDFWSGAGRGLAWLVSLLP